MDTTKKTTDELLELLNWIRDRQRYRNTCGITSGTAYAEECAAEDRAVEELTRRGYYQMTGGTAQ